MFRLAKHFLLYQLSFPHSQIFAASLTGRSLPLPHFTGTEHELVFWGQHKIHLCEYRLLWLYIVMENKSIPLSFSLSYFASLQRNNYVKYYSKISNFIHYDLTIHIIYIHISYIYTYIIYTYVWDYNLIGTFIPSLSSSQAFLYIPLHSPSNSWPPFSLFVTSCKCTCICLWKIYIYIFQIQPFQAI